MPAREEGPLTLERVLAEFIGHPPTENIEADLSTAGTAVRYEIGQRHRDFHATALRGGIIIKKMRELGWSWHRIAVATNIPPRTAGRWLKIAEEYYSDPTSVDRAIENWKLS